MGIIFWGDLYYGYDEIRQDITQIASYIQKNGYTSIVNLEGPCPFNTSYKIKKRGEHLAQGHSIGNILKCLNVAGVSLSNNHMFDFGVQGVRDTLTLLEAQNIAACGVLLSDDIEFPYMDIQDDMTTYRVYSATDPFEESVCSKGGHPGCYTIGNLLNIKVRKNSNNLFNIAFLHTGFEYNTLPSVRTIKECHQLIDNGFDYVICSHPHITQPYEIYKGKPIFYSLGNFYFSEFRDEFHNKKIKSESAGACDFGIGVAICRETYQNVFVKYEPEIDSTVIVKRAMSKLTYTPGLKYLRKYSKNRNNYNPILTGTKLDYVKMQILYLLYSVYGLLRKIVGKA